MIHELRRLPPMHTAKVMALLYGAFFLLVSLFTIPLVLLGPDVDAHGNSTHKGILVGVMVAYPIVGLIFGWLGSALMSAIYNFVAKRAGGLRFETTPVDAPE
jgi:hypothetical protein